MYICIYVIDISVNMYIPDSGSRIPADVTTTLTTAEIHIIAWSSITSTKVDLVRAQLLVQGSDAQSRVWFAAHPW